MRHSILGAVISFALLLAGCAGQVPNRSAGFTLAPECRALYDRHTGAEDITTPESMCWKRSSEERKDYDLLFAEFDDQGWTQGTSDSSQQRADHIDQLMSRISALVNQHEKNGISLVVFVHGWHHSADANDSNVREFRSLLRDISVIEGASGGRRVVGLFVGWRGDSITIEGLNVLTFWDRKATAEKVSQGSVRELFARLDAMRDHAKSGGKKAVRMITIGHSFGGLITFELLSSEFIRGVARHREATENGHDSPSGCIEKPRYLSRVGDLVVVVNPAYEGARYEPLRTAAQRTRCISDNQWPVLITATSVADDATGIAFPWARRINTLFEIDPEEEHNANIRTVGHNERYTTHKLTLCDKSDHGCLSACSQTRPLGSDVTGDVRNEHILGELTHIRSRSLDHFGKSEALCDGLQLASTGQWVPMHNPYWVVETSGDVMRGHNDIFNPAFVAFIRQVYIGVRTVTRGIEQ